MARPGNSRPTTTFVLTDTHAFREVVQKLTGPEESGGTAPEAALKAAPQPKRPTSKLHERRQYKMRPKLEIVKPPTSFRQACVKSGVLASPVGTPSNILSELAILEDHENNEPTAYEPNVEEEEKAIREKRFYLHPSPRSKPPELLTLFPLTSPGSSDKNP